MSIFLKIIFRSIEKNSKTLRRLRLMGYTILQWMGFGIMSSIGLGFGFHTGPIILFPYVAKTALIANDFIEGWLTTLPETLAWGLGTAMGELPPFLFAHRLVKAVPTIESEAWWARFARWGERQTCRLVREYGGWAIFALSCWPNLFFDCAGVAAGVGGMDFRTFFLATVAGKVLVKAPMQTAFAAASALHALDGPDSLPNTITMAVGVTTGFAMLTWARNVRRPRPR